MKNEALEKKIEKLEELVEHLEKLLCSCEYEVIDGNSKWQRLKKELAELDKQTEIITALSGEEIKDIKTVTSTEYPVAQPNIIKEQKQLIDYFALHKINAPCLKGISCNLCETIDKKSFAKCLNNLQKSIVAQPDRRARAEEIVEENFKGLDSLIDDKDILQFYKDLIVTCLLEMEPEEISDDWIEKEFPVYSEDVALSISYSEMNKNKRIGAKAYREQLRKQTK